MRAHRTLLAAAVLAVTAFDQRDALRTITSRDDAPNVILVVSDGLRWQEVFRGADSTILFGPPEVLGSNAEATRRKYWRSTPVQRREALMPFVWGTLARQGRAMGNRDLQSLVDVTNSFRFSYPGYNEMLTGAPDPRIDRNDFGPNPNVTVFEWLNRRRDFRGRVAAFGTWDTFHDIFNVDRSGIAIQTNGAKPNDIVVHRQVIPYMREVSPLAVFVGYAETDDWGHEGRYDRFLDATHAVDSYLEELWLAAQSDPQYKGRTTLVFAADHGRGRTPGDWMHHGDNVPGAEETFILAIGPGIAPGATSLSGVLGDVARLAAAAVGLEFSGSSCRAGARC
jgi:hypothetical protein